MRAAVAAPLDCSLALPALSLPARAGGFFSSGPKLEQCVCLDKNGTTVLQVELDSVRAAQDTVKDLLLVCNAAT